MQTKFVYDFCNINNDNPEMCLIAVTLNKAHANKVKRHAKKS